MIEKSGDALFLLQNRTSCKIIVLRAGMLENGGRIDEIKNE